MQGSRNIAKANQIFESKSNMSGGYLTKKDDFNDRVSFKSCSRKSNQTSTIQNAGFFFRKIDALTSQNRILSNPYDSMMFSINGASSKLITKSDSIIEIPDSSKIDEEVKVEIITVSSEASHSSGSLKQLNSDSYLLECA